MERKNRKNAQKSLMPINGPFLILFVAFCIGLTAGPLLLTLAIMGIGTDYVSAIVSSDDSMVLAAIGAGAIIVPLMTLALFSSYRITFTKKCLVVRRVMPQGKLGSHTLGAMSVEYSQIEKIDFVIDRVYISAGLQSTDSVAYTIHFTLVDGSHRVLDTTVFTKKQNVLILNQIISRAKGNGYFVAEASGKAMVWNAAGKVSLRRH